MRHWVVLAAVALAGCGLADQGTPNADSARRICVDNGHSLGSEGFHRCFETTYAAIMGATATPVAAAPRVATVCNRVGNTMICN